MPAQDSILLQTKLHQPRLPRDLITRTQLLELLHQDINRPLILVCAPAGFGKSTLVSTWLKQIAAGQGKEQPTLPAVWLSLDENDSDLNLFLRYFIAALKTVFPDACENTLALLKAQQPPPESIIHSTLINELEKHPEEFILVLDDYHTIHDTQVHDLLGMLVRHWPRSLHLVLISRLSPPIPLSSMRAKGMLTEIRTRQLRFTSEETATYLSQSRSPLADQNALSLLEERFEGWPAGLHLAELSLRSADSQDAVLSALSSMNADITAYLMDEVLNRQFPAIRYFLLQTSILDRFCAPLCEAIVGEVDPAWNARSCLEWIERSELFLIPLDDQREWYRYHHLFQELLQQRLSAEMAPEEANKLHLRASAWLEEQGLIDKALQHALAAGDIELAARQMKAGLRDVINREDRPTLERWLHLLPDEMIHQHPWFLLMQVWVLQLEWQLDKQAKVLQELEELLETEAGSLLTDDELQILLGNIAAFHGQLAYLSGQPIRAVALFKEALDHIFPNWTYLKGGAMHYLGMSMQASGQGLEAERLLLNEYAAQVDKVDPYALRLLFGLCFIYHQSGQLENTRQIALLLLHGSRQSELPILLSWAERFLGMLHYERNDIKVAAQYFNWIIEHRYTAQIATYRDAVAGLALIHQILGKPAEAWQLVESISQYDLEQSGSEHERTRSLRARLMLLQGDLVGAGNWVDLLRDPSPEVAILWLEEPQMTRVRVLLARGREADLQLALQNLDALEDITNRTHNTPVKIEVLALRALVLDKLGETSPADTVLNQALDLARQGGFIRLFADLGEPMRRLLQRLGGQEHAEELVRRILAAFQEEENYRTSPAQPVRRPSLSSSKMAEPLTPRELEVLTLLNGSQSIKEIAGQLHISYATAKRHTINIYAKLGVNRRWEAVAKARELGILSRAEHLPSIPASFYT